MTSRTVDEQRVRSVVLFDDQCALRAGLHAISRDHFIFLFYDMGLQIRVAGLIDREQVGIDRMALCMSHALAVVDTNFHAHLQAHMRAVPIGATPAATTSTLSRSDAGPSRFCYLAQGLGGSRTNYTAIQITEYQTLPQITKADLHARA